MAARASLRAAAALLAAGALTACGGSSHHTKVTIVPRGKVKSALPQRAVLHFASDQAVTKAVSSAHVSGKIVASIPFDPAINGFSFQNYGFIAGTELGAQAMRQLFGDVVCATTPSDSCTLTPAAQQWAAQITAAMAGGHCYGFSMTALRFFDHNLDPAAFGASNVYSLGFSASLQQTIAADWATQALTDVNQRLQQFTPAGMVQALEKDLSNPNGQYYTLVLANGQSGAGYEGHAITPIGIANAGNGQYEILVYDNNYPGTTRAVQVDTNSNTWRYLVEVNPSAGSLVWTGQGQSNPLGLVPVSTAQEKHPCPFCGGAGVTGRETISLGGNPVAHAHLLIKASGGRELGYIHGRFYSRFPGATVLHPSLNAIWKTSPEPIYQIPAGVRVSVTLSGGDPTGRDAAQIGVTGPGFGETVANLVPTAGSTTTVSLLPGGTSLAVRQTAAKAVPSLQLARDRGRKGKLIVVTPHRLASGSQLSVGLPASGQGLHVSSTGARIPVHISVKAVGPQGTKTRHSNLAVAAGQSKTVSTGPVLVG